MPTSVSFWVFAAIASFTGFVVTLLLPFGVPFGVAGQVILGIVAGVGGALWFVRAYPDAKLTPRNVFFLTPWWIWAGLLVLFVLSGYLQGINPLQMIGGLLGAALLVVGLPWFIWWCIKDLFRR